MLVDLGDILSTGAGGIQATLDPDGTDYHRFGASAPVYAGVKLDNNGSQYAMSAAGAWSSVGAGYWLNSGTTSNFWVKATLVSGGPLDAGSSATGSWLALTTSRDWVITDFIGGTSADVKLELSTDASGTPITNTVTYTLYAENIGGGP